MTTFFNGDLNNTLASQRGPQIANALDEIVKRPRVRRGELRVGDDVLALIADPSVETEDEMIDRIDADIKRERLARRDGRKSVAFDLYYDALVPARNGKRSLRSVLVS